MQSKRSLIHSQALRISSDKAARDRGLEKVLELFLSNGYPCKIIRNIQNAAKYKQNKPNIQKNRDRSFISLPYIDETLTRKINAAAKSSELDIQIAWQSGPTLYLKT